MCNRQYTQLCGTSTPYGCSLRVGVLDVPNRNKYVTTIQAFVDDRTNAQAHTLLLATYYASLVAVGLVAFVVFVLWQLN